MGNSNDPTAATPPCSVLSLDPSALCPDETLEASWPSVSGKGDMTGKETKSDKKLVPQVDIFLQEEEPWVNYFLKI